MIREERLLKVLRAPHVSEKASTAMEKSNTIVLKVAKDATKAEIKAAVQKLFEVEVEVVNTLVVKGKLNVTDSVSVVVATGKSLRHPEEGQVWTSLAALSKSEE